MSAKYPLPDMKGEGQDHGEASGSHRPHLQQRKGQARRRHSGVDKWPGAQAGREGQGSWVSTTGCGYS